MKSVIVLPIGVSFSTVCFSTEGRLLLPRHDKTRKMSQEKPTFDYHEESQTEKLARKSKESPFMVIGITGLVAAVGYGAYAYKRRGAMSTSVFLMQFRVIAQGTVVGALTAGMMYTLYKNHFNKLKGNEH